MSDLYEDDGWEATVTMPRLGGGKPFVELYVVAVKERTEAETKIASLIDSGCSIHEMIPVKASVMQTHGLFPGGWTKLPSDSMTKKPQKAAKLTDAERHKRFVEIPEKLGADKDERALDRAIKKVMALPPPMKLVSF